MKTTLRLFCLLSLVLVCFAGRSLADEVADAKLHINARQSDVVALKKSGVVGENNRGYLEIRDGGGSAASVVTDENRDRNVLYAELTKRTGISTDEAGRARAKQIAANSAPGVWLQRDDGGWYQK